MALRVIGMASASVNGAHPEHGEIDLPPGTLPLDLVLLGILAGFNAVGSPSPPPSAHSDDPRMAYVAGMPDGNTDTGSSSEPARNFVVYAGAAGDLSPIKIALQAGDETFGQFAGVRLIVLRDDSGAAVEMDGRVVRKSFAPLATTFPPGPKPPDQTLPGLPETPDAGYMAVCLMGSYATEIGGLDGRHDLGRLDHVWTPLTLDTGNYLALHVMVIDRTGGTPDFRAIPEAPGPSLENEAGWDAVAIGLRPSEIPAIRQYPRDDGLGLSSAPRLYPPPKSQRIVGGHQ